MEIGIVISILSITIAVSSFVLNRKDKAVKDGKDESSKQSLISYRLDELTKKVDKILNKLDNQEQYVRDICKEELEKHILMYHKKGDE